MNPKAPNMSFHLTLIRFDSPTGYSMPCVFPALTDRLSSFLLLSCSVELSAATALQSSHCGFLTFLVPTLSAGGEVKRSALSVHPPAAA